MSAPTIRIKPLVWRADGPLSHRAANLGVTAYLIDDVPDDPSGRARFQLLRYVGRVGSLTYDTLAAAKAAAQEEWDAFVRAAVEVAPAINDLPGGGLDS